MKLYLEPDAKPEPRVRLYLKQERAQFFLMADDEGGPWYLAEISVEDGKLSIRRSSGLPRELGPDSGRIALIGEGK